MWIAIYDGKLRRFLREYALLTTRNNTNTLQYSIEYNEDDIFMSSTSKIVFRNQNYIIHLLLKCEINKNSRQENVWVQIENIENTKNDKPYHSKYSYLDKNSCIMEEAGVYYYSNIKLMTKKGIEFISKFINKYDKSLSVSRK